jgi:thymidylate kinase
MNRMILIDGVEASGKTTLINKLKTKHPEWSFVKCPSPGLINNRYYEMISDDFRLLKIFVDELIGEVRSELHGRRHTTFVLDRGVLSTLVFQGRNHRIVDYIWKSWTWLFRELGVNFAESATILMLRPVIGASREHKRHSHSERHAIGQTSELFVKHVMDSRMPMAFYCYDANIKNYDWCSYNDIATEVFKIARG